MMIDRKDNSSDNIEVLRTDLVDARAHLERYEEAFQHIPGLFFVVDADSVVLLADDSFARLFGQAPHEMIGHSLRDLALEGHGAMFSVAGHAAFLDGNRTIVETQTPIHTPEYTIVDEDDQTHTYQLSRVPYTDPVTGNPVVMGIASDITRRVRAEQQIIRGRNAMLFGMMTLAESRDNETGEHLERVCAYAELLADDLREEIEIIDEAWIDTIAVVAALHDIGKVGVPDAILCKPGKLTPEEHDRIKRHTTIGADALIDVKQKWGVEDLFLTMATEVAVAHHERWDGAGYPYGLKGEQIPLAARIVAVADTYDALTQKRRYKAAQPHTEARAIILAETGHHFDPKVCDSFARLANEFEIVSTASTLPQ
jgi:PAS domain S-box-containing protein